jgi:hypothetical protein
METKVVAFLESDRRQWLKQHLAKVAGRDTVSASRYLLCETFARLARLRRAGTVDAVVRNDFEILREACDDELIRMARASGSARVELLMPVEELQPEESSTPTPSWPCSGQICRFAFTLQPAEAEPHRTAV